MEETQKWWDDDSKKADQATISQFEEFITEFVDQRKKIDTLKLELETESEKLTRIQAKALQYLKTLGRDNYQSKFGLISIVRTSSVALPKTPEDRAEFFGYLKDKGLFDSMISVNSQTLNSWFRQEYEIAQEEKRITEFKIPGLKEPATFEKIRLTKGK